MYNLELWQYALLILSAFFLGLGKGGLPGVGNLTVVLAALVLPAKASVGILLPILISADIIAVLVYRRHTEWRYIRKLAPWVIVGIVIGYFVFSRVDDAQVRFLIGFILLSMTAVHFYRKWARRKASKSRQREISSIWSSYPLTSFNISLNFRFPKSTVDEPMIHVSVLNCSTN